MNAWDEVSERYDPNEIHEIDDLWNLCEDFSVTDAAALIAGYNPSMVERCANDTFFDRVFPRYEIALLALTNSIKNKKLAAAVRFAAREYGHADQMADIEYSESEYVQSFGSTAEDDERLATDHSCFYKPFPNWKLSTVSRDDLVPWLSRRGVRTGFFFSDASDAPDYLDPCNPRYSKKLAAAVRAWQAVTNPGGKSPKQALEKWLREHAGEFGLTDDEGNPVTAAMTECSTVANWQTGGGAPKTPSE